jgi:hypothetical protein
MLCYYGDRGTYDTKSRHQIFSRNTTVFIISTKIFLSSRSLNRWRTLCNAVVHYSSVVINGAGVAQAV